MCHQISYEKKGINFTEAIKKNKFVMGYEQETGFKISNPSEFMKINETILSNAIKKLFNHDVNSITLIFGHHHKLKNFAPIIANEKSNPGKNISYFPISDKMHIYFLPPTGHMNQFAIWGQQIKIEEYENNKSKKNDAKIENQNIKREKIPNSKMSDTALQNNFSKSIFLVKTLGFAMAGSIILSLAPENKNIIKSNMLIQEKLVSFFKENKKYLSLIGVTSIALSYLLSKKDSKKKYSIVN
jgi:hypothetical protein